MPADAKSNMGHVLLNKFLILNSKGFSATARALGIWVLELEAPSDKGVTEVKLQAEQVKHALGVYYTLEAVVLLDHVIFRDIFLLLYIKHECPEYQRCWSFVTLEPLSHIANWCHWCNI